jgi:hypothetical protein
MNDSCILQQKNSFELILFNLLISYFQYRSIDEELVEIQIHWRYTLELPNQSIVDYDNMERKRTSCLFCLNEKIDYSNGLVLLSDDTLHNNNNEFDSYII